MTHVVFYEKPGCGGNAKQKAMLIAAGHTLEVRNLLTQAWTPARLLDYFGDKPVSEWFNPNAPRVKSGAVDPSAMDAASALALMVAEPIFIHRPLMEANGLRGSGFSSAKTLGLLDAQEMPCAGPGECASAY